MSEICDIFPDDPSCAPADPDAGPAKVSCDDCTEAEACGWFAVESGAVEVFCTDPENCGTVDDEGNETVCADAMEEEGASKMVTAFSAVLMLAYAM